MSLEALLWEPDDSMPPLEVAMVDLINFYNNEFAPMVRQMKKPRESLSYVEKRELMYNVYKLHKTCIQNRER